MEVEVVALVSVVEVVVVVACEAKPEISAL